LKKQIGKYKLLKELGKGGMGEVYLAHQTETGAKVALKILPPELTRNPQYVQRFRREAEAVSRLDHPHIIKMYEIGEDDGVHYIAMEHLGGAPLETLLKKRGPLPIREAAKIIMDVAGALDFAHSEGIIHRDIKPDNILSDERGEFKVMDFGIARIEEGTQLTVTGTIMGTPEYMSPEQGAGKKVDQRTDIYSLGIVFYEMLTGKVPFRAETALKVIQMHMSQTPESPKILNPEIPGSLAAVVGKMVEKNPADRYASFQHVINAVVRAVPKAASLAPGARAKAIQPKKERHAERQGPRVRERVVARAPATIKAALVLSIALNIALFGLYLFRPAASAEEQVSPAFKLGSRVFAPPAAQSGVMYIAAQDGTLYACDLRTGSVKWTFETGDQITAAPLVDGDRVYVASWDRSVYALDAAADGMLLWKVNVGDIVSSAPVLSDGTVYVTTRGGSVYALDAETGATRWKDMARISPRLPPVVHNDVLFIGDDRKLIAYDAARGRRLGSFPTGRLKTAPVSVEDRLYYIEFDDDSGRDELRLFLVHPGTSPDAVRVIRPEWSVPLASDEG